MKIPIARAARELLEARPHIAGRDLVFGKWGGRFTGWAKPRLALDERTGPLPHWVIHDLRRSVATGMADIGIQPHIIEGGIRTIVSRSRGRHRRGTVY